MAVEGATRVVAAGDINNALDCRGVSIDSTRTPWLWSLTVEIANTQQASGLEAVGQRVDNTVVVCRKHHQSELFASAVSLVKSLLTRDHRQAVAHGDQVRTIGGRTIS